MRVERLGNPNNPLLVCAHGLMGGPEDFMAFRDGWKEHFHLIIPDMDEEARKFGFKASDEGVASLCYDQTGHKIADYLKTNFPGRKAYFVGVSLGGKIIYEMAGRYPELFLGGVSTDISPGPMTQSSLYHFIENTVPSINLNQNWKSLKEEIKAKVPDPKLRILIQTQIKYDSVAELGEWKSALAALRDMLKTSRIENQWNILENCSAPITVLRGTWLSGIGQDDVERMSKLPHFKIIDVPGASHFLHISHHQVIDQAVRDLIGNTKKTGFSMPWFLKTIFRRPAAAVRQESPRSSVAS